MTKFWDDVATSGATVFQYIGELCRYLTNAAAHPLERKHRLRLAFGNGLRPDVWPKFVARFGVAQVGEFYAATEGNVQLFNLNSTPAAALKAAADGSLRMKSWPGMGAVGRMGFAANAIRKFPIVRFDMNVENVVRDSASGLCISADTDEAGEMLGVVQSSDPTSEFKGYAGGDATGANDKKLLRNVFGQGDLYFRTGDLLRRDAAGYIYFSDRIGDTFRWHGENVATTEVAEVPLGLVGNKAAEVLLVKTHSSKVEGLVEFFEKKALEGIDECPLLDAVVACVGTRSASNAADTKSSVDFVAAERETQGAESESCLAVGKMADQLVESSDESLLGSDSKQALVGAACHWRSSPAYFGIDEESLDASYTRLTRSYDFVDEHRSEGFADGHYVKVRRLSFADFLACDAKRVAFLDVTAHTGT
jgi:acyl-CoA synthetase (AMP-forming)/AMP-acid ligase II